MCSPIASAALGLHGFPLGVGAVGLGVGRSPSLISVSMAWFCSLVL
ncbi:hypothetical protein [Prochlorothrix hollandica]|nr:hypothetical protein [Prochlorothrix hollandica]